MAEQYKNLLDAGEDTSKILEILGEDAAFVETMVQQGYTSVEEFISALREGKMELSSMEAGAWIQGLVNLREASADAQEEVKNLKDRVEQDLKNETSWRKTSI